MNDKDAFRQTDHTLLDGPKRKEGPVMEPDKFGKVLGAIFLAGLVGVGLNGLAMIVYLAWQWVLKR